MVAASLRAGCGRLRRGCRRWLRQQWSASALDALADPKAATGGATDGAQRRRVKELERELRRKDKALAEAAALLVLSKKLSAIFQEDGDE